ncbi:MAG: hypothetical protein COB85_05730 [Bacteroidetes bacterium]|nr:MAG: hypothetical protein COB85_05730 [Bacteroidota bacterium]
MKLLYIAFASSIGLFTIGCSDLGSDDKGEGNDISSAELVLLASNFRSEAAIIVDPHDEEWIGKFDNTTLIDDIFDKIYDGSLVPYDLLNNKMEIEEIKRIEFSVDTLLMEDFETGELTETVIEESLARDEITKIFLREDWYYDRGDFNIKKEVVSVTLTTKKYDLKGDFVGYQALFVVYMNGKGPTKSSNLVN